MSTPALRDAVHSAFAYVRSSEVNQAVVTFDHVIDQQISFLKQDETRPLSDGRNRVSRYDRLKQVQADLDDAITTIENMEEI